MITFKRVLATARLFSQAHSIPFSHLAPFSSLNQINKFSFAFISLFENNKTPAELNPVFKRKTKIKGHVKFKNNHHVVSSKLNPNRRQQKKKLANHKGLLKRIKIVILCLSQGWAKMGQTIQVQKSTQIPLEKKQI